MKTKRQINLCRFLKRIGHTSPVDHCKKMPTDGVDSYNTLVFIVCRLHLIKTLILSLDEVIVAILIILLMTFRLSTF